MNAPHSDLLPLHGSGAQVYEFVRAMLGGSTGREDDEHPLRPGPWDPVIRIALKSIGVFGPQPEPWLGAGRSAQRLKMVLHAHHPHPEPWKIALATILARHPEIYDAIGGGHSLLDEVALNPQPLPPRYSALIAVAQTLVSRVELLEEISQTTVRKGEQQGIIIVGGYVSRFTDDFCGTGFKLRWPFPGPRPHWFAEDLDGIDLIVMATQFNDAARESFSPDLRRTLADAASKFTDAGLSRMH